MPATVPSKFLVIATALGLAGIAAAAEQSMPGTENGHYALTQTPNGVVRLDTRTGAVSNCDKDANGWACTVMPDERAALDAEIGRLQAENDRLKAQLAAGDQAASGKTDEALPKSDQLKKPEAKAAEGGRNKIEIPLPSDQDMDRMMSFLERAWRRLIDMANRMQKDVSGRI
jgi:hypothetical protein